MEYDNTDHVEAFAKLCAQTPARLGIGHAGARLRTATLLKLRADHSEAIDAVWSEVNEDVFSGLGFVSIQTLVSSKEEYIRRPDLGRKFSPETLAFIKNRCINAPDVQIIVADGLSAPSIEHNVRDAYEVIADSANQSGYSVGTPLFVHYGRVATMDAISEVLGAKVTILLVGERPGLATGDSMGCYMAYESSTKKPESQRTVISNIHRNGTPPVEAGAQIVSLIKIMMREKMSGVGLNI